MDYWLNILLLVGIYVMLGHSLNLIAGYAGLLSLAHAAFFGIGAYIVAIFMLHTDVSFWVALPVAMAATGIVAAMISSLALRVHDDYLVLATFSLQAIFSTVLSNWSNVTGGTSGISGIRPPSVFGTQITEPWQSAAFIWVAAGIVTWFLRHLLGSPFGRTLRAIREDEILVTSYGKPVMMIKIQVFAIGAAIAALAGGLYAVYVTYIDPTSFTIQESIFLLSIVIVGGAGTLMGPVVGASFLVGLPEVLRTLGISTSALANLRQVLYGGLLVIMVLWRPQGLMGKSSQESSTKT